jgi:CO/xanthine dehydrogenase FAD-binding subunit
MLLKPFTLHTPHSLTEAVKLYGELADVKIIAGGTFLLNSLKLLKRKGTKTPQHILSLRKIQELKGVLRENGALIIKAMTTIHDLYESPFLTENFGILKTVCRNISTQPIRNMATIGGNLTCRYTWTELGAVMIALGAKMEFITANGQMEGMDAETFFQNAARTDKIFVQVRIPHEPQAVMAYRRVKKTMHVDVPLLAVCVKAEKVQNQLRDTRITVNNGIAFAQRDRKLEAFLESREIHPDLPKESLDHLDTDIYDKRNDVYKQHMFRVSLKNAVTEVLKQFIDMAS